MRYNSLTPHRKSISIRLSLFCFFTVLLPLSHMEGKPVAIPAWAESMQKNPPEISPEIVSEVDDLWAIMQKHSADWDTKYAPDAEYIKAARRFVELKEQACQAMLWQYFKEPPVSDIHGGQKMADRAHLQDLAMLKGQFRYHLLDTLQWDPQLAQWFLPLFRDRIEWTEQEVQSGRFLESIGFHELAAIQSYLYLHGTMADLEAFEHLLTSAEKAGIYKRKGGFELTLEEQASHIRDARKLLPARARPLWQKIAIFGLPEKQNFKKTTYVFADIDTELQALGRLSSHTVHVADSKIQKMTAQIILGGLIFLAVLLLTIVFKKRREMAR